MKARYVKPSPVQESIDLSEYFFLSGNPLTPGSLGERMIYQPQDPLTYHDEPQAWRDDCGGDSPPRTACDPAMVWLLCGAAMYFASLVWLLAGVARAGWDYWGK